MAEQNTQQDLREILQIRRDKLKALQDAGMNPFEITRYDVTHHAQEVKDNFDALEGQTVSLGGRLMSKRGMGKVSFCDLQDKSGRIQIYARRDEMDEEAYNRFKKFDIGDIVGVRGEVFRTQKGEMSIRAHEITLLSKSLQPLPEKFHGLTDKEHPTQMLADFMTMKENFGTLEGLTLAYCGQGRNNVQNSLMITSAILGVNYVNATPAELEPDPAIVEVARAFAAESGATITVTNDPVEAVENADAIYTNVWAAMGEESQFAERVKLMSPYQVNAELLSHVKNPDYIFLHCLPAFHNAETEYAADMAERFGVKEMEVTDEVFYSDHGRQFQQAENRMHTIKAIMAATLGDLYIPCV